MTSRDIRKMVPVNWCEKCRTSKWSDDYKYSRCRF